MERNIDDEALIQQRGSEVKQDGFAAIWRAVQKEGTLSSYRVTKNIAKDLQ